MSITLTALQKQRRDTAANWTTANPTLLAGEIGLESDTGYWKVGDGSTAWTSLAYVPGLGAEIPVSRLADGTARQLLQTAANGTDVEWTSNVDVPGTLDVTGVATFDNNVIVQGDLTVNGTTTTIDTTNLAIEDKNIEIGKVATPTDVTADGGGITLKGTTDKTINWVDATDAWTFSEHINIASGKEYRIAGAKVLDATSLGSAVVSSSLTSVGTIGTGTWQGTAINKTYLDSTLVSTGDTGTVTSTMIADGTIVNGDINASAAIAGTKISPDFGSQNTTTTGTSTAASFIPTSSTAPTNGVYLPAANSVAISTNGTGRLFINSSGQVGIGTTASANLSLPNNANINFAGAVSYYDTNSAYSSAADRYIVNGAAARYIQNAGAHVWQYAASGTAGNAISFNEAMRITSGGLVGIGIGSPSNTLHVAGTGSTQAVFERTGSNGVFIGLKDGSGSLAYLGSTNGVFSIQTPGSSYSDKLVVTSAGLVGIGTSSPAKLLEVNEGDIQIRNSSTASLSTLLNYGLTFRATNQVGQDRGTIAEIKPYLGGNSDNDFGFQFRTQATTAGGVTTKMTLTPGGSLGIGTTTPGAELSVVGDIRATGSFNTSASNYIFSYGGGAAGAVRSGLYLDGTNTVLSFFTAQNERARIDSSGRLLVGTSSYSGTSLLVVQGKTTGNDGSVEIRYNGTSPASGTTIGSLNFRDQNGTFAEIRVDADAAAGLNDYPARLVFSTTADGASSPTERCRITNAGAFLVGRTSSGWQAGGGFLPDGCVESVVASSPAARFGRGTTTGDCVQFRYNDGLVGSISVTTTNTAYNTSSDYRLKENVEPVVDGITRLQQLKPSRFNFIADPDRTVDGFIAHEVQAVVPEAITGEKDAVDDDGNPVYQGIDQSKLVPLLTAALQEAIGEIESLKARIAALEAA